MTGRTKKNKAAEVFGNINIFQFSPFQDARRYGPIQTFNNFIHLFQRFLYESIPFWEPRVSFVIVMLMKKAIVSYEILYLPLNIIVLFATYALYTKLRKYLQITKTV